MSEQVDANDANDVNDANDANDVNDVNDANVLEMCDRSKDINANKCNSADKCLWCYKWGKRNQSDWTHGIACFGYMVNPIALRYFLFSKKYIENLDDNLYQNLLIDQKYIITEG